MLVGLKHQLLVVDLLVVVAVVPVVLVRMVEVLLLDLILLQHPHMEQVDQVFRQHLLALRLHHL